MEARTQEATCLGFLPRTWCLFVLLQEVIARMHAPAGCILREDRGTEQRTQALALEPPGLPSGQPRPSLTLLSPFPQRWASDAPSVEGELEHLHGGRAGTCEHLAQSRASQVAPQWRLRLPVQETRETQARPLGGENPLEKEMATHSGILAWKIPWTEEPGGLQPIGSQRGRRD